MADAEPRGAGAEEDQALRRELFPRDAHPRKDSRERDAGRALNVVIKTQQAAAISSEDRQGFMLLKFSPWEKSLRNPPHHRRNKGLDQLVVGRPAEARCAITEVKRDVEQL